ncbi:rCG23349 [Rattus norvegicus]|uniref:RCG23349 n=1 Tax=Rattus norvegicus TaxID=10116 RepID=A6KHE4_RAT|nr:rCG23349 [Rattus norvegicus]
MVRNQRHLMVSVSRQFS